MIKVGEMIQTPQMNDMKKESLLSLSKEKHIQNFFKQNHINRQ